MNRRDFLGIAALSTVAACIQEKDVSWGRQGLQAGEFIRPRAISVKDGEVYVIDTTGRVQVFSEEGVFLRSWKTPDAENGTPTAVTFDRSGNVIVPDTHYSKILEYTSEGKLLHSWGEYGTDKDKFIYPTGLAISDDGSFFFSEYGLGAERIHVFDSERRFLRQWGEQGEGDGQFSRAMAIVIDEAGIVYVGDTANHRIQCFKQDGTFIRSIGGAGTEPGKLKFPYDITLAPDGTLLAAEYGTHRISRFKTDGTFIGCYGKPGRGPGQFNGPRGVAVSKTGKVFVTDTENHRIEVLSMEVLS